MQHCQNVTCWELLEDIGRLKQKSNTRLNDWYDFLEEIPEDLPRACKRNLRESVIEIVRETPIETFHLKEWLELLEYSSYRKLNKIVSGKLDAVTVTEENKNQFLDLGKMAQKLMRNAMRQMREWPIRG